MLQNIRKWIKKILKKRKLLLKINHNSSYWILVQNKTIIPNLILVSVILNQFSQCNRVKEVIQKLKKERKNDNKY